MAQCRSELVEDDAIWYCTREKGHEGHHRDDRGTAWDVPEDIEQTLDGVHEMVEAKLDEAERARADQQQGGDG